MILRYFAEIMNKSLDQFGITIIDVQNNGSPGAYIYRVFDIPWTMISDNDQQYKNAIKELSNRCVSDAEIKTLVRPLGDEGVDLEKFLFLNGFKDDYLEILLERRIELEKKAGDAGFDEEIIAKIRKEKTLYTIDLIRKLRLSNAGIERVPTLFQDLINDIVKKAGWRPEHR